MNVRVLAAICVMAGVTTLLRAAPFVVLGRVANAPVTRALATLMPPGVMVILVFYSVSSVDFGTANHALPPIAGIVVTAAAHLWRRNALLSIVAGTLTNILLLRLMA